MSSISRMDLPGGEEHISSSLRGNQPKYYNPSKREYVKFDVNRTCLQGLKECVVSSILDYCFYKDYPIRHATYISHEHESLRGVRSPDFLPLNSDEVAVSLILEGAPREFLKHLNSLDAAERLIAVADYCGEYTSLGGVREFFGVQFLLDYMLLNEDRHWSNISFLENAAREYSYAPYFDFAESLSGFDITNVQQSWIRYEPNPYLQEQLQVLPKMLCTPLVFRKQKWLGAVDSNIVSWRPVYTEQECFSVCRKALLAIDTFPIKEFLEVY